MKGNEKKVYLNIREIKFLLFMLSIASAFSLIIMKYDLEFKITLLLPICYFICLLAFIQNNIGDGIGGIAIIVMYAFRMCILPILCAYGNFWLEPEKSIYIAYYNGAIFLTCFECFLVFCSFYFWNKHYKKVLVKREPIKNRKFVIKVAILSLAFVIIILFIKNKELLSYFRFITAEEDSYAISDVVLKLQSFGTSYYLLILVDIIVRPLISFWATSHFLEKKSKFSMAMVLVIGIVNIVFVSDRRILSLLIGGCCMVQLLPYMEKEIYRKVLYVFVVLMALLTICYFFYGTNEPYLIARKFQRYFSGPTLTAIGIAVKENFVQSPIDFFKRLFNDSILLTGLFYTIEIPDYVRQLCGPAGKSIWTPMMIGSVQYFSIFAPIVIIVIVNFIVKCDWTARNSESNMHKLMANYLSISVAIYMVMYTVDLIFYTIIFFGILYKMLIWLDKKIIWDI